MGKETVITWVCDGCGMEYRIAPVGWLETSLRRRTGEGSCSLHALLLCVGCQERMLDALEKRTH